MMSLLNNVVRPLVAAGLAVTLAYCNEGCFQKPAEVTPDPDQVYSGQIAACTALSKTKAESVECRRTVNRSWGVCGEGSRVSPC